MTSDLPEEGSPPDASPLGPILPPVSRRMETVVMPWLIRLLGTQQRFEVEVRGRKFVPDRPRALTPTYPTYEQMARNGQVAVVPRSRLTWLWPKRVAVWFPLMPFLIALFTGGPSVTIVVPLVLIGLTCFIGSSWLNACWWAGMMYCTGDRIEAIRGGLDPKPIMSIGGESITEINLDPSVFWGFFGHDVGSLSIVASDTPHYFKSLAGLLRVADLIKKIDERGGNAQRRLEAGVRLSARADYFRGGVTAGEVDREYGYGTAKLWRDERTLDLAESILGDQGFVPNYLRTGYIPPTT